LPQYEPIITSFFSYVGILPSWIWVFFLIKSWYGLSALAWPQLRGHAVGATLHRTERKQLPEYIVQDDFFWQHIPLDEMTSTQWESLCDGCGKCCVLKLEDVDTNNIYYTDVGCKLLDCETARCRDYQNRKEHVSDCIVLSMGNLPQLRWMPDSCAYRLLYEGKSLPDWHPLVSGNMISPVTAGHSVAGRIFPETEVDEDDLPDHITDW